MLSSFRLKVDEAERESFHWERSFWDQNADVVRRKSTLFTCKVWGVYQKLPQHPTNSNISGFTSSPIPIPPLSLDPDICNFLTFSWIVYCKQSPKLPQSQLLMPTSMQKFQSAEDKSVKNKRVLSETFHSVMSSNMHVGNEMRNVAHKQRRKRNTLIHGVFTLRGIFSQEQETAFFFLASVNTLANSHTTLCVEFFAEKHQINQVLIFSLAARKIPKVWSHEAVRERRWQQRGIRASGDLNTVSGVLYADTLHWDIPLFKTRKSCGLIKNCWLFGQDRPRSWNHSCSWMPPHSPKTELSTKRLFVPHSTPITMRGLALAEQQWVFIAKCLLTVTQ